MLIKYLESTSCTHWSVANANEEGHAESMFITIKACLQNIQANMCHLHFVKIFVSFLWGCSHEARDLKENIQLYKCILRLCVTNFASLIFCKASLGVFAYSTQLEALFEKIPYFLARSVQGLLYKDVSKSRFGVIVLFMLLCRVYDQPQN